MSVPIHIQIELGALSRDLAEQLTDQGVKFDEARVKLLQMDADAITRCSVRGLVSDSACIAARKRLFKSIEKNVLRIGK